MNELEKLQKINELSTAMIELMKVELYVSEQVKALQNEIDGLKEEV
jgi:hypothetical protein